jgi:hypothetical protein
VTAGVALISFLHDSGLGAARLGRPQRTKHNGDGGGIAGGRETGSRGGRWVEGAQARSGQPNPNMVAGGVDDRVSAPRAIKGLPLKVPSHRRSLNANKQQRRTLRRKKTRVLFPHSRTGAVDGTACPQLRTWPVCDVGMVDAPTVCGRQERNSVKRRARVTAHFRPPLYSSRQCVVRRTAGILHRTHSVSAARTPCGATAHRKLPQKINVRTPKNTAPQNSAIGPSHPACPPTVIQAHQTSSVCCNQHTTRAATRSATHGPTPPLKLLLRTSPSTAPFDAPHRCCLSLSYTHPCAAHAAHNGARHRKSEATPTPHPTLALTARYDPASPSPGHCSG